MNDKEKLLKWLDTQVEAVRNNKIQTEEGVEICNMNGDMNGNMIFIYNVAELARIVGEELQIEPREGGKEYNARVFFMYKGVKIYDLFNIDN